MPMTKQTAGNSDDLAHALSQTFTWLSMCFAMGDRDYREQFPDEAARRDAALKNGTATISAQINLHRRTVDYVLTLDDAAESAREIALFSQSFEPRGPLN